MQHLLPVKLVCLWLSAVLATYTWLCRHAILSVCDKDYERVALRRRIAAVSEERDKLWQVRESSRVVEEELFLPFLKQTLCLHCSCQTWGLCRAPWRLNLSIPHSFPSQNVTSHTGVFIPLLHISLCVRSVGSEGKAILWYFQGRTWKSFSACRNIMSYKLTVISLEFLALIWCISTDFNNQTMQAQHKKLWLFWSHHDPRCIKLWQGASQPLSVKCLGK